MGQAQRQQLQDLLEYRDAERAARSGTAGQHEALRLEELLGGDAIQYELAKLPKGSSFWA